MISGGNCVECVGYGICEKNILTSWYVYHFKHIRGFLSDHVSFISVLGFVVSSSGC